jgi:hypothetical protein
MAKTPQTLLETFKLEISQRIKHEIQASVGSKTMQQIADEYGLSIVTVRRFGRELFLESGFKRKAGRPRSASTPVSSRAV